MNHHQPRLFLALAFLIEAADFLALGQIVCINEAGNYTTNSGYSNNLNTTLSSLSRNVIDSNGFYNSSVGQGIDTANALVLCKGDAQLDACRDCVETAAAELRKSCPNQKQAIRWDGTCMLRYSNATMYRVMATTPAYYLWNTQNASNPERFKEDLRALVDRLLEKAISGGSLRKVAAASVDGPDFQTIFAFLECTPDLSQDECSSCLIGARSEIPVCCDGKRGGVIVRPSCNLRFETYPFFNETRLQELDSAPVPPPVPVMVPPSQSPPPPVKDNGSSNTTRTLIIIVVPITVCLALAAIAIIWLRKREKLKPTDKPETGEDVDEISTDESVQYAFSTIKAATNEFSDDNKLGQGGFGTVYKGGLPNGREIAVKRLSMDSGQGDLEFKNEVLLLAKLQHRNLVRLLGFALEGMERLLVYEFVQNASLDLFIFDPINQSNLDWDRRLKIVVGIARGILYLHEDSRLRIIHRDLKASNILLDRDMNPKIADFGMARLFGQDETQANTSRVVGTYGYMSPEYLLHGQFSIKSDVFSFGVLVLEIISGRKNSSFRNGESVEDLLSFAWKNWREGTAGNVVDPLLRSSSGSMSEIVRCIHIGLLCVQENAGDRPTMASVVIMLSSFSMSLAVPSQPAFYSSSGYGSDVSRIHNYNPTDLSGQSHPSVQSSQNDDADADADASISELYPR